MCVESYSGSRVGSQARVGSFAIAFFISYFLKYSLDFPRPESFTPPRFIGETPGFPSLHTTLAFSFIPILTKLFGEFSPSRGDYVFSKTGEIIGLMVDSENCVILNSLDSAASLEIGRDFDPARAESLNRLLEPEIPVLRPLR